LNKNKPKIFSLILGNMSERSTQEVLKEIGAEEWLVLEEEKVLSLEMNSPQFTLITSLSIEQ
jgi:hypothetical protein